MNLFFLVEGEVAETTIYRGWLAHLVPQLREVDSPQDAMVQNYYLISSGGQSKTKPAIKEAINEVNARGNYDYLVVCLDAEESTVELLTDEIHDYLQQLADQESLQLEKSQFILIVQNRCLETWFLGNRTIYPVTPKDKELSDYLVYYHAAYADPELMGAHDFLTHAQFHKRYWWLLLSEQKIRNSKLQLNEVARKSYLAQLQARVVAEPSHLQTFQTFINFCQRII